MRIPPTVPYEIEPKIALVDAHPGYSENKQGRGYVNVGSRDLAGLMATAGISFEEAAKLYVFNEMPPGNQLTAWCDKKKEVSKEAKEIYEWPKYDYPAITKGKFLRPYFFSALFRLREELEEIKPNLVVTLGAPALWAMCRLTGVEKNRGSITLSTLIPGMKVLPTYSPMAAIAQYQNRVIIAADMLKAAREMEFPQLRRPHRTVYIAETLDDVDWFFNNRLTTGELGVDLETLKARFISCGSFAPSPKESMTIPFISSSHDGRNHTPYWNSKSIERRVWERIANVCADRTIAKVLQNGLYDVQYLQSVGIALYNFTWDTMLFQHAMYLELPKSLGFLGSIETDEIAWKTLRPRGQKTEYKRDA